MNIRMTAVGILPLFRPSSTNCLCGTWDVDAIVFNVHLMQAGLRRRILDGDGAVFVVSNVGFGHLTRRHSDLTFRR